MTAIPLRSAPPALRLRDPCEVQVESGPFLQWAPAVVVGVSYGAGVYDVALDGGGRLVAVPQSKVRRL